MDALSKREWNKLSDLAVYCFDVNEFRIEARCSDEARYDPIYQYSFSVTKSGLNENPNYTGEIMPVRGSIRINDENLDARGSFGYVSFSVTVWPKTDLGMLQGFWRSADEICADILKFHGRYAEKAKNWPHYVYPKNDADVEVLTVKDRLWGHVSVGDYRSIDQFFTELTEHLVVVVRFDASSCWPSEALPPADIKAHVMAFFLDYLNHFDIITRGSVPDEELPPLGFYPSKRDEKEIDAEGKTIESRSEAYASESLLKW